MVQAKPAPDLKIPPSDNTVKISIIDTTAYIAGLPNAAFMEPAIPGYDTISAPCYSMLIEHKRSGPRNKYDKLIWDLGIRVDWENSPKVHIEQMKSIPSINVRVEKDVATILRENGEKPENIGGIIWSHWHFDHTGDPSTFPGSTDLIVGPGFKKAFVPGFPTFEESPVHESAYKDRELREIDFEAEGKGLKLGRFNAMDFYGDGSFYLLDTPGHAIGHMCALARTTAEPPTFTFLGGDIAHHGSEFRPTLYLPLPDEIEPNPLFAPRTKSAPVCPGHIFEAIHPTKSRTETFTSPTTSEHSFHHAAQEAKESVAKMTEFDGHDSVFPVIAHDESLFDVVDFYPASANDWKAKGWKTEGTWRFLRDFDTGSAEHKPQYEPSVRNKA